MKDKLNIFIVEHKKTHPSNLNPGLLFIRNSRTDMAKLVSD